MAYITKRHEHDYGLYAHVACGPLMIPIAIASAAISTGLSVVGSMKQAGIAKAQGQQAMVNSEYQAKQLEQRAGQERAVAQRAALEKVRTGQLAQSTLVARAAASGGGATDETVLGLGEQIAGRTEYERLIDMFKGEDQARGLEDQAAASRASGAAAVEGARSAASGYRLQAIGQGVSGVSSMFAKFGGGLPTGNSTFGQGPLDLNTFRAPGYR